MSKQAITMDKVEPVVEPKAVVVPVATALPAVPTQAPKGFDDFDMEDLIVPRIRLLQSLSDAVQKNQGKIGEFQDSLSEETLGSSLEIVLLNFKNGAIYFKQGEGMKCKSNDGIFNMQGVKCTSCPYGEYYGKFHEDGTPPGCSASKEFLVVRRESLKTQPYPMLLSFIKTSLKMGKKLISMARLTGQDIFAHAYTVTSVADQRPKGKFANYEIRPAGKLTPEELAVASEYHNIFAAKKIQAHDDLEFDTDV